jgi:type VI protein secretion system component Hcp
MDVDCCMIIKSDDFKFEGESTQEIDKTNAFEIQTFSISGSYSESGLSSGGEDGAAPRVQVYTDKLQLSVTKLMDSSSPGLMVAFCQALTRAHDKDKSSYKPFKKLTIVARKVSGVKSKEGRNIDYLRYDFEQVYPTSYSCSGQDGSNKDMPSENLSFGFKKFRVTYWPQSAEGRQNQPMIRDWDFFSDNK